MGMLVNPFGSGSSLEVDRALEINQTNFPETSHSIEVTSDILYGTNGNAGLIRRETTNASYQPIMLFPTVSSGGLKDDEYNNLPNEFYLEVDRPSLVCLPNNFIEASIRHTMSTTPSNIAEFSNAIKRYQMRYISIYADGVKLMRSDSFTGQSVGTLPPSLYYVLKNNAADGSMSGYTTIYKEANLDSGEANVTGGDGYLTDRITTDTNIRKFYSTSSSTSTASGYYYQYPAVGNETIPNHIFIERDLLIRVQLTVALSIPKKGSTDATSLNYTVKGLDTRLNGTVIQYK